MTFEHLLERYRLVAKWWSQGRYNQGSLGIIYLLICQYFVSRLFFITHFQTKEREREGDGKWNMCLIWQWCGVVYCPSIINFARTTPFKVWTFLFPYILSPVPAPSLVASVSYIISVFPIAIYSKIMWIFFPISPGSRHLDWVSRFRMALFFPAPLDFPSPLHRSSHPLPPIHAHAPGCNRELRQLDSCRCLSVELESFTLRHNIKTLFFVFSFLLLSILTWICNTRGC